LPGSISIYRLPGQVVVSGALFHVADVFQEVDEQLRSQQLQSLLRRGWPFAAAAAGLALIVALGIWGWGKHQADQEAKASIAYQAGLDAAGKGDTITADQKFADVAASGPPAYRALALMKEAQIRLEQKKSDDAVRLFDQAAKAAPDVIIGDAARLKAAWALTDTRPLAEIEARLTPLTGVKSPYRSLAREALAMARLQAGKLEEAKGDFTVLSLSEDASQAAQARAHAAIDLIQSGTAASLPAAIKAAAAAPIATLPSPSAPQVGAAK
jgi:hypothetical protein